MAKVTSKLQVTIPKRIAEEYGIAPGDEIEFVPAGDVIRVVPPRQRLRSRLSPEERLRRFDAATARIREYQKRLKVPPTPPAERDWKREDLYTRGKPR
ncbi:MAG: AbrB/MazE/SpoVT family DNA-binding domain-containing protein [Thermoanaerobaculia bacterium]